MLNERLERDDLALVGGPTTWLSELLSCGEDVAVSLRELGGLIHV